MQNQQDLVHRLTKLEEETKLMEPQGTKLEDLTSEIVDYAHEYLNTIDVKRPMMEP